MFVIGVAGQAQMGKDTLADKLGEVLNEGGVRFSDPDWPQEPSEIGNAGGTVPLDWTRAAFAANVKKVFMETFDVDMDFIEEWKVKDENPPGFDMNVRKSLQFIGDGFRQIRYSIWLDLCFRDTVPKIISDVRYINEFKRVKEEGGLNILVGRTEKLNDDPNGSEAIIRPYCEWALNNLDGALHVFGDEPDDAPEGIEMFDVFVRNDGTKEDFYCVIEEQVVPFVKRYNFKHKE